MIKLFINLSKHRPVSKRRGNPIEEPILPTLEEIKNVRAGSRFSRIFRHIFEHKNIKKILGPNIAFAIIITTAIPASTINAKTPVVEPAIEQTVLKAEIPTTTNVGLRYPVKDPIINQGFRFFHPGIDIEGRTGDHVYAVMAGRVSGVQHSRILYGNAVFVDHGNGVSSLYAHLSKIAVKEGDSVDNFTKIGEIGSTGRSTGDHLHLEIHRNGIPVNPTTMIGPIE